MMLRPSSHLFAPAMALALCLACWAGPALAQQAHQAGAVPVQNPVRAGERLSDWLVRSAPAGTDTTALHWQIPAERATQEHLRQAVLWELAEYTTLADLLQAQPLTGRLTVARADARWLQADPAQDPVLQDGHRVLLLPRPTVVTLLSETGQPCSVAHAPGALVTDYLAQCWGGQAAAQSDWAWVAQPDGRTQRVGTAPWSHTAQDPPGPGAWVWAPSRQANMTPAVSDNLVRFLATQLPAEFTPAALPAPPLAAPVPSLSEPRDAQLTASDWGEIGLLQTPTARMSAAGEVRMHWSRVYPYTRGTVMFQPLDWLEAGFRYSDVSNRLYGPAIAGDQTYKDKSIDVKLRLRQESATWPELALGVRDLGGTGLFAGEYLVASKRWGNWDASLGLGWGYLGARGTIKTPLAVLGEDFATRTGNTNTSGGTANFSNVFHGPAAPFGGVQWHAPQSPWVLKLELDGNDYQHEPQFNNQPASSPLNLGAVYRYSPYVDLSLGLERGNRLMFGFTLHGALNQMQAPKLLDPPLPRVNATAPLRLPATGWAGTAQAVGLHTGWKVQAIRQQQATATVVAQADGAAHLQDRIDRAVTLLNRDAPASVQHFELQLQQRGLPLADVKIDRAEWLGQRTVAQAPALRLPAQQVQPATAQALPADAMQSSASGFSAEWAPSYSQILGGPDDFLLYQLGVQATLEQRFSDSTWVTANFNARLLDNYRKFVYDAPSNLPRVRTNQREYVTTSRTTMPLLQLTHVADMGAGNYVSAYAGMLEPMYGGVGAEWLYRPWQSRWAVGLDLNHVQQRDFHQNLSFRDYSVNTGHATVYWDTGWNDVQVKVAAGQYLAGDVGATLDVRRVFENGVALGAWATRTNVSAEQFGEGSYDKGIYIKIPFDVLLPKSSAGSGTVVWNPLSRDGGARLSRSFTLHDLTSQRDARAWRWSPGTPTGLRSAEERAYVATEPVGMNLPDMSGTGTTLARQVAGIPASTWLWAGGAVLASGLLDRTVDRWVTDGQGSTALGNATNAVPYALALGTSALWAGVAGQPAADTASTALAAAAITLGANLGTRFVVGRSRPLDEQGPTDFNGLRASAVRTGFASNHVAMAFALATPFAQQYDMPWLYAAAAATGLGRVQNREHWLSDTVAGAFMGYAVGAFMSEQQLGRKKGMRLTATPQSVAASWAF